MVFVKSHMLSLLWLVPAMAIFLIWAMRNTSRALRRLIHPDLVGKLADSTSRRKRRLKAILILGAIFLSVLALARPQYGKKLRMVRRKGIDIVIALDTSDSMLAEDIKPNRLERAKQEVTALIDRLQGDRVALVTFAGDAIVQCPLTTDYGAAKMFLDVIERYPVAGTAIGKAVEKASGLFQQEERKYKAIILITDGEDHRSDPISAAEAAAQEGVRIYTIGVGSPAGVPIPLRNERGALQEYKKDRRGETVMSRLDEATLQRIALESDGKYLRATTGEMELETIVEELSQMERKELKSKEMNLGEERYQVFVLATILMLTAEAALGDRRRKKRHEHESA